MRSGTGEFAPSWRMLMMHYRWPTAVPAVHVRDHLIPVTVQGNAAVVSSTWRWVVPKLLLLMVMISLSIGRVTRGAPFVRRRFDIVQRGRRCRGARGGTVVGGGKCTYGTNNELFCIGAARIRVGVRRKFLLSTASIHCTQLGAPGGTRALTPHTGITLLNPNPNA